MSIDLDAGLKIAAPLLTLVVGIVTKRGAIEKPRLIFHWIHPAEYPIPVAPVANGQIAQINAVRTHSIIVRNAGKASAKNVTIGQMRHPPSVRVWPAVAHTVTFTENNNPQGASEIRFASMAPGESISIAYLYGNDLTAAAIGCYVKSDEGIAQRVEAIANPPISPLLRRGLWTLAAIGGITTTYWLLRGFVWFLGIS